MKNGRLFHEERIWRWLTNLWTLFFLVFVVVNFLERDAYESFAGPMSIIYISILSLYVGTKEFDRWYQFHDERHPGEWFILLWTAVVATLFVASVFLPDGYRVPGDVVAAYIAVLSIFALTQKSKRLHARRAAR